MKEYENTTEIDTIVSKEPVAFVYRLEVFASPQQTTRYYIPNAVIVTWPCSTEISGSCSFPPQILLSRSLSPFKELYVIPVELLEVHYATRSSGDSYVSTKLSGV
jgi:hypothetical protein